MANTITNVGPRTAGKISIPWTSDGAGAASVTVAAFRGYIRRVVTNPTDGPTDNYDVTLTDADGVDVLGGTGADRDTTNSEQVIPSQPILIDGALTLVIANAGAAKSGVVVLYIGEG